MRARRSCPWFVGAWPQRIAALAITCGASACSERPGQVTPTTSYLTVPESALKGVARTNHDSPTPTRAQLDRKERSHRIIVTMNLPWLDGLPVVEDDAAVKPRSKDDVVGRCLATEFCAVRAEGRDAAIGLDLVRRYHAEGALSPKERAFLDEPKPSERQLLDFAWGYECTHVFLWALGYLPQLNEPSVIADVKKEAALIRDKGPERFAPDAHLRPISEILDQNDLYYRIHWALIDLRLKDKKSERADEEIVDERHRALNWLIRYMNQSWDDVTTDT